MPKFKVGDLVDFLTNVKYGYDFGTRSHMGIITDYNAVAHNEIWRYQCYAQILQQYFWVEERHIKFVDEEWKSLNS